MQDLEPWAHSGGDPADNTGLASPPPHPEAAGHALLQTPAPDGDAGWQLPGAGGGHLDPKCPPFSDSLKPLLFFFFFFLEVKEKEKETICSTPLQVRGVLEAASTVKEEPA